MSMKSMTMIPPMSRRRSWRAISSAASRLLRKTVSSRFDLPDVLAGVDVDDRERLGALDDERATRRQPHLAVERLEELLVDVEPLEDRQPLLLGVVELDPVGELGGDRLDVAAGLLVERAVVDDDAAVLLGELLADAAAGRGRAPGRGASPASTASASSEICSHWLRSRRTSRSSSSWRRALGRGAHDQPGVGRVGCRRGPCAGACARRRGGASRCRRCRARPAPSRGSGRRG